MIQRTDKGDLKLKNVDIFSRALKVTWVKRLFESAGAWYSLCRVTLKVSTVKNAFELDIRSLTHVARKCHNIFWKEVCYAFIAYMQTFKLETELKDILALPLWDTYFITNNNVQILGSQLQKQGCRVNKDLVDKNTLQLMSCEQIAEKYNCRINYLDHCSLIQSIPGSWKNNGTPK